MSYVNETHYLSHHWDSWLICLIFLRLGPTNALTYIQESWHTYEIVMTHIWAPFLPLQTWSHTHTCEWVVVHIYIYMNATRHTKNESWHTYEWVMAHVWMSHGTHICIYVNATWHSMNELWHAYEWVMTHIWMSHDTHMNGAWHTYEWVMAHVWVRHCTDMSPRASFVPAHAFALKHTSVSLSHTSERVMAHRSMHHGTWVIESRHTYEP